MGRAARSNPTAIAAKKGELPPKQQRMSKRELERLLYLYAKAKIAEKTGLPDYILEGLY